MIDTTKGIDQFCKEKIRVLLPKEHWKYSGQARPVPTSDISLAGNDFTWSGAFPVNQLLMMSEV